MALYAYRVYQSDKFFNEQISMNKYSLDDLVSVKIPVHMPTIQDGKEYIYISGQIQFKSISYNYVKLKMTRDTIFLMCVPNYKTTRLYRQNIIDARKIADIPFNKKGHVPFAKANSISIYDHRITQYKFLTHIVTVHKTTNNTDCNIIKSSTEGPFQPPDVHNIL
jgi:hypothetical protein